MTLRNAYAEGRERLRQARIPEADLDAWYLLEFVTGISRAVYYADPDRKLTSREFEQYENSLARREKRIPLQHITGEQEFMGLTFLVNEHVLIPRQDTEILVEEALKLLEKQDIPRQDGHMRILDMCTGSGCILLSVLCHAGRGPGNRQEENRKIQGVGSDVSEQALETARENARRLGMEARFLQGDLFENVKGRFSMILSNPPYIRTAQIEALQEEVRLYDPRGALDGREDGLYFYRRITEESAAFLLPGGYLAFEIGYDQAEEVSALMRKAGYGEITVKKDLAGLDRVVLGRYIR